VVLWLSPRSPQLSALAQRAAAVLLGASLFYVWLLLDLGVTCRHCLSIHLGVAALALTWWRHQTIGYFQSFQALALGFLFLHLVLVPRPWVQSGPPSTTVVGLNADQQEQRNRIESNRRLGDANAPWRLDVLLDFHCPHCARLHGPLWNGLRSQAGERLSVVPRLRVSAHDNSSAELSRYALAAASVDADSFLVYLASALGSRDGDGYAALRPRLSEVLDTALIEARVINHSAAITAILTDDALALAEEKAGQQTPQILLVDRASGEVRQRWEGEIDVATVLAALRAATDAHR